MGKSYFDIPHLSGNNRFSFKLIDLFLTHSCQWLLIRRNTDHLLQLGVVKKVLIYRTPLSPRKHCEEITEADESAADFLDMA